MKQFNNGYTTKTIPVTEAKPKKKYPWLENLNQVDFAGELHPNQGGTLRLQPYKGYLLVSMDGGVYVWLDGDGLDAAIELLKKAKQQWLRAYKRAKQERDRIRAQQKRNRTNSGAVQSV